MKEGWEIVKLSEVINQFIVPQRDKPKVFSGSTPWCRIEDFDGRYLSKSKSGKNVSQELIDSMPLRVFPINTVIVSCSADLGRCAIIQKPLVTNQTFIGLVPSNQIFPEYLYYLMGSMRKQLNEMATGATIKYLSKKKFQNLQIPIPALAEQKQIVTLLDQAFAAIDKAKANIEKNITNAKELFQSKLNEIFSQKGDGYEENTLIDVCEIRPPKKLVKEKLNDADLVSFVPMKYLGINQMYFNSGETKTLKQAYSGYVYFEEGDVILAKITPCFENGKLGIAKDLKNGVGFGSSEYVVYRADKTKISSEYLYFFLNRENFRIKGKSLMSGAVGHKRIQPDFYEKEMIFLPKIDTQKIIIGKITTLQQSLNKLEKEYERKLISLEELKKSLLQKGFAGELTSKDSANTQTAVPS